MLATEVLFCSKSTRDEAINSGLCDSKKAVLIGDGSISGIDVEKFSPVAAAKKSVHLRKSMPAHLVDKNFILFVGRLVPHKGVDTLLTAWSRMSAEVKKTHVLLVAGANDGDRLYERLLCACEGDDSIHYLGRVDNIVGLYGICEFLVLPSWHEGFPYSVLEAQSCGVPAIVTNVTGNRDSVQDNFNGLVIDVGNPLSLAKKIEQLVLDKEKVSEMGCSARELVLAKYDQQVVMGNLIDYYKNSVDVSG
jgi:glycosyltransferase involved in cell wall biosynthesis